MGLSESFHTQAPGSLCQRGPRVPRCRHQERQQGLMTWLLPVVPRHTPRVDGGSCCTLVWGVVTSCPSLPETQGPDALRRDVGQG